ncbi:phosphatidylinositol 3-kinase catalytic subunit [Colletotrichum tofieldiae]|nr:phosphatidylinositol 3-kinase catalytic subunit [Colletotrichum tofieldiae]
MVQARAPLKLPASAVSCLSVVIHPARCVQLAIFAFPRDYDYLQFPSLIAQWTRDLEQAPVVKMEPFSFASSESLDYPVSIRMYVPAQSVVPCPECARLTVFLL